MQLFKKGQSENIGTTPKYSAGYGTKLWFADNKRSIAAVALIVIAALFMRTIFAYAVSAGSGFALSGGTVASEHLRNIVAILDGNLFGPDGWLYFPYGSSNVHPPLIDLILAGFAFIVKAITGMSAAEAASFTLGASSAIMGALACIPMYYLGKELFDGKKRAGFLAALFLAFCPIVITNTVFSNGTTIAFTLFFVILMMYFIVKGVRLIDNDHTRYLNIKDMLESNRPALMYALYAGIVFVLIAYSWNGFRSLVLFMIFLMLVMMVVNRLTPGKDARPIVAFFTVIIGLGVIVAAPYYILAGLWDLVFSGILYAAIIGIAVCISFSLLQDKPWVYTIPGYIIGLVVIFVALNFALPDVFNVIVNGNSIYAKDIQGLISTNTLSLSAVATYFGYFTMWCGAICAIYMVFNFSKNVRSNFFLVEFFAVVIGMLFAVRSTTLAVVYSPFFALAFAAFIEWVFDTISFSDYFKAFRGCDAKTAFKKVFDPKPFIAIVCVLLLIAAPNMLTAVDASISNNEKSDWNEGASDIFNKTFVGSMGYTVYTDNEYKINYTLKSYGDDSDYNGTMLTWIDYSADVATYGHFKSITDTRGNNAVPMAQILLADETRGEATAAMIVYSVYVMGYEKGVEYLNENHIDDEVAERLLDLYRHTSDYRTYILEHQSIYGKISNDISDENVIYLFAKKYLSQGIGAGAKIGSFDQTKDENFTGLSTWKLAGAYEDIANHSNSKIDYIMVTLGMLPIQYGDGSVFSSIASIAGYTVDSTYGSVPQFYSVNSSSGAYSYTAAMYNTLLYKSIGGKTSAESADSMDPSRFEAIYGISNFNACYDNFFVQYNTKTSASASDDGWKVMTYVEANKLKAEKGGSINYFGYPVVIKFAYPTNETVYGKVTDSAGKAIENARVDLWDNTGKKVAIAYTDKEGNYEMPVPKVDSELLVVNDDDYTVKYYAGAAKTDTAGGTLFFSDSFIPDDTQHGIDAHTETITFSGYIDFADEDLTSKFVAETGITTNVVITLTGTNFEKVYDNKDFTFSKSGSRLIFTYSGTDPLVIDTYSIKITTVDGTSLGSGTYTMENGDNTGYRIAGTICEETVTVNDVSGVPISGATVTLTAYNNESLVYTFANVTDYQGQSKTFVMPGKYILKAVKGNEMMESVVTISSSSSSNTIALCETVEVSISGISAGKVGNADALMVTNGIESYTAKWSTDKYVVNLPKSGFSSALYTVDSYADYMVYQVIGSKLYVGFIDMGSETEGKVTCTVKEYKDSGIKTVSGELFKKDGDSEKACSGTVYFVIKKGQQEVMIGTTAIKEEGKDNYSFKFLLPVDAEISYEIYATNGSSLVKYADVPTNADSMKIVMEEGYKVSGKFYWGSSNYFSRVKITLENFSAPFSFVITDADGYYSFIVPKSANTDSSKVVAPKLASNGAYYFLDSDSKPIATEEHKFNSTNKSNNFVAHTNDIKHEVTIGEKTESYYYKVVNGTGYKIIVDGKELAVSGDDSVKYFSSELRNTYITVKVNFESYSNPDGTSYYVYCDNIKVKITPSTDRESLPVYTISSDDILNYLNDKDNYGYTMVKVKYADNGVKPTVTITNMRSSDIVLGEGGKTYKPFSNLTIKSGTDSTKDGEKYVQKFVKYNTVTTTSYKEKDQFLTNPYLVKITYTKDSVEYLYYDTLTGNEGTKDDYDASNMTKQAVYYSGSVGVSYSGELRISFGDQSNKFTATVSSGSYSVALPEDMTVNRFIAVTTSTSGGYEYTYQDTIDDYTVDPMGGSEEKNPKRTLNFASTLQSRAVSNDPSIAFSDISTELLSDGYSKVTFKATVSGAANGTYKLSGGSDWDSIRFYDSTGKEITAVTSSGTDIVITCIGVFKNNVELSDNGDKSTSTATAAWGSQNLSVKLSTIAGKTYVSEYLGDNSTSPYFPTDAPTEWNDIKTNLPLWIEYGVNKYSEQLRVYSMKVVNPNNFPVKFNVSVENYDEFEDFNMTVMCGNIVQTYTDGSTYVVIPGASTTEINIQITPSENDVSLGNLVDLELELTTTTSLKLTTSNSEKITIVGSSGNWTVDTTIKINTNSIDVKDHSASGRGVFDFLASAPVYLMILGALMILGIIAMIWLGIRRGVFSRKN